MQESEEELNERLRQLKGLDKERDKNKKMSKQEQEEENLFKKNKGKALQDMHTVYLRLRSAGRLFCSCRSKVMMLHSCAGVGHFNNNFKVADDIRMLGAVPEEEEEREVPIDKHMAKAMEERLLRGIEQEMLRDKQAIIRSFMKDSTGMLEGQFSRDDVTIMKC